MQWTICDLNYAVCLRMTSFVLAQAQDDAASGTPVVSIPDATASKDAIVDAATRNVYAQMDTDRKTTGLKSLQVFPAAQTGLLRS